MPIASKKIKKGLSPQSSSKNSDRSIDDNMAKEEESMMKKQQKLRKQQRSLRREKSAFGRKQLHHPSVRCDRDHHHQQQGRKPGQPRSMPRQLRRHSLDYEYKSGSNSDDNDPLKQPKGRRDDLRPPPLRRQMSADGAEFGRFGSLEHQLQMLEDSDDDDDEILQRIQARVTKRRYSFDGIDLPDDFILDDDDLNDSKVQSTSAPLHSPTVGQKQHSFKTLMDVDLWNTSSSILTASPRSKKGKHSKFIDNPTEFIKDKLSVISASLPLGSSNKAEDIESPRSLPEKKQYSQVYTNEDAATVSSVDASEIDLESGLDKDQEDDDDGSVGHTILETYTAYVNPISSWFKREIRNRHQLYFISLVAILLLTATAAVLVGKFTPATSLEDNNDENHDQKQIAPSNQNIAIYNSTSTIRLNITNKDPPKTLDDLTFTCEPSFLSSNGNTMCQRACYNAKECCALSLDDPHAGCRAVRDENDEMELCDKYKDVCAIVMGDDFFRGEEEETRKER